MLLILILIHTSIPTTLLLIAHPDDETMFFSPTITQPQNLTILCLSSSNNIINSIIRKQEILNFTKKHNIKLIIHNLIDNEDWNISDITILILYLDMIMCFDIVYTFDKCGVSGHKNHISCYNAMYSLRGKIKAKILFLKSKNLWNKYFIDVTRSELRYTNEFYGRCMWDMVVCYKSQMRWYRYLYIIFSNYMIINDFLD